MYVVHNGGRFKFININPSKMKRRLLYLKTHVVPSSKHFSSQLLKPISLCFMDQKSLFILRLMQNK